MADVLRRLTGATRFSPMVEGLPEVDDRFDMVEMPAFANSTGLLERDIAPDQPNEFQLRQPQLSPQRNATPTLGQLTLPEANTSILGERLRRPMVEGMPEVELDDLPQGNTVSKAMGAYPAPASEWRPDADTLDRRQARRADIAQGVLQIGGALAQLFTPRTAQEGPIDYSSIFNAPRWSDAPNARIAARAQENAARVQAEREAEDRAMELDDRDFRRAMDERRAAIEERRIAQAEGATSQDQDRAAAMYDPNHPAAQSARIAYARLYRAIPPQALAQLSAFQPDGSMRAMSAMDLRAQAQSLMQAWGRLQQANPRLFVVGRRSVGGRSQRGVLPGLGTDGQRRTIDYGVSEGLTPEDYAVLGIDPSSFGMEVAPQLSSDDASQLSETTPGPQPMPPQPRPRPRPRPPAPGPAPAPQPAPSPSPSPAPGQPPQPAPNVPAGRPIIDRDVTSEEWEQLPADQRSTVVAIRSYMRANPPAPGTDPRAAWQQAAAAVQGLQPAERSRILTDYGTEGAEDVPGWRRTGNVTLQPAELVRLRSSNASANRINGIVDRIESLYARIGPAQMAQDRFTANEDVAEVRNLAREVQALMRDLQNLGVPNGPELEMVKQQAPEMDSPRDLYRLLPSYRALRRQALASHANVMQSNGFVRAGRRQR